MNYKREIRQCIIDQDHERLYELVPKTGTEYYNLILDYACSHNLIYIISYIVYLGYFTKFPKEWKSVFITACIRGSLESIKLLVSKKPQNDDIRNKHLCTLLYDDGNKIQYCSILENSEIEALEHMYSNFECQTIVEFSVHKLVNYASAGLQIAKITGNVELAKLMISKGGFISK